MSDRHNESNSHKRNTPRHRFAIHHQAKQRLLLKALNEMNTADETPEESRAITEMVCRLEQLLSLRQRARTFRSEFPPPPAKLRKRCSYGSSKPDTHNALNGRA